MRRARAWVFALALASTASPARAARDTTWVFPELAAPVRIATDRNGIAHLEARSLSDLYFAWGLTVARDRMWQLEASRRAGQGRMWEWTGNRALRADGGAQLFEFADRAHAAWERERRDPGTRLALERFADGVNACFALCRRGAIPWAPEFTRLRHTPEDWRPEDSILLLYGMGVLLDLDVPELAEADTLRVRGRDWYARRRRFEGEYEYASIPDSAAERLYRSWPRSAARESPAGGATRIDGVLPGIPVDRDPAERASNVFAVGPGRSASGVPLLANDFHLSLSAPAPLHVIHVTVKDTVDAAGACVPGLPIIVSGRNREASWGITSLGADVIDVYADTLSADGRRVRSNGAWVPLREADYSMRFRFLGIPLPTFGQKRRYTPHGPVLAMDSKRHLALAMRWSALEAPLTVSRLLGLERSRSAEEAAARARTLVTPTLNVVAADARGGVIYQTVGAVPRRPFAFGRGALPADGRHEWSGFIAPDSMPSWRVAPRAFVVSANNLPVGAAYPEAWPRFDWIHDRAARMAERLAGDRHVTPDDMRSVQNDVHSRSADRLLPRLIACADSLRERLTPKARAALDTLRAWDRLAYRDRVAPTLFRAWIGTLFQQSGLSDVPGMMAAALEGRAPGAFVGPSGAPVRPAVAAVAALDSTLASLERLLGPDLASWTYGRAHRGRFRHALAWLDPAFQPEAIPMDGDNSTPSVGPSRLPGDATVVHGPAWRHLVDLAVADSSLCVIPPGNRGSGPHRLDQMRRWANHSYVPLYLSWERIEASIESDVRLSPR